MPDMTLTDAADRLAALVLVIETRQRYDVDFDSDMVLAQLLDDSHELIDDIRHAVHQYGPIEVVGRHRAAA